MGVQEVLIDLNSSPECIQIQLSIIMELDRAEFQAGVRLQFGAPAAGGDCGGRPAEQRSRLRSPQLDAGGQGGSRRVWARFPARSGRGRAIEQRFGNSNFTFAFLPVHSPAHRLEICASFNGGSLSTIWIANSKEN